MTLAVLPRHNETRPSSRYVRAKQSVMPLYGDARRPCLICNKGYHVNSTEKSWVYEPSHPIKTTVAQARKIVDSAKIPLHSIDVANLVLDEELNGYDPASDKALNQWRIGGKYLDSLNGGSRCLRDSLTSQQYQYQQPSPPS